MKKRTTQSLPRKHSDPIVESFLNRDPEPESLLVWVRSLNRPIAMEIEAIQVLLEVTTGRRPGEDLDRVHWSYRPETSVDLHILLLNAWFRAIYFIAPDGARLRTLRDRIISLLSDRTPPEIVGWSRLSESLTYFHEGNTRDHITVMNSISQGIDRRSPHHYRLSLIRLMLFMQLGMSATAQYPPEAPLVDSLSAFKHRLRSLNVVNAAMTGTLSTIEPDHIQHTTGPAHIRSFLWPFEYEVAYHTLRLHADQSGHSAPRGLTDRLRTVTAGPQPEWIKSSECLASGRVDEALHWARMHIDQVDPARRTVVGFDEYTLIRAELSASHGDAARRLLRARHDVGTHHYMDHFFSARIELLEGHPDRAAQSLAKLFDEVDTFQAKGRLDLELRLARELPPTTLLELAARSDSRAETKDAALSAHPATSTNRHNAPQGIRRIIHCSAAMSEICERILSYAPSPLPVLITGETGTGKELIALALHEEGHSEKRPYIAINCASLSDTLIESELFGHTRGAFTGAQSAHRGLFRDAGNGTLFLDEIGDISPRLQASLLRVLETNELRPVGSTKSYSVSCRVIAATNASLDEKVERGDFRRDLLFRLRRLEIHLPPLRRRAEDTVAIAQYFLDTGRPAGENATITEALCQHLRTQRWPGNIRELRNVIERMRLRNSDKIAYDAADFTTSIASPNRPTGNDPIDDAAHSPGRAQTPHLPATRERKGARDVIASNRSPLRRMERVRELFVRYRRLQAAEVARIEDVSRHTAARDLRELCREGFLEKICPTASPRTHYYAVRDEPS